MLTLGFTVDASAGAILQGISLNHAPVQQGVRAAGQHLAARLAIYASAQSRAQPPRTEKQRRYVHWAIREGIIRIPYPRTGTLSGSWELTQNDLSATVGSQTGYAGLVKGQRQAQYHQVTGHKTAAQVAQEEGRTMADSIGRSVGVWVGG